MRKCIIILSFIIFFIVIGVPIYYIWVNNNFVTNITYGIPELIYYSAQVIGSVFTVMAVCVALFGKEIRALYFNEHLKISLLDNGFYENLGDSSNDSNPVVHSYDTSLNISNDGAREVSDVQILLKEVFYRENSNGKFKRIVHYDNKSLYWSIPEKRKMQILVGDSVKMPLFKIYPEDSCQTPDRSAYSTLRMRIIGCRLDGKYSKKGNWKTVYQLQSNEKILKKIECEVEWDGKWCNRLTEMSDGISVNLKIQ